MNTYTEMFGDLLRIDVFRNVEDFKVKHNYIKDLQVFNFPALFEQVELPVSDGQLLIDDGVAIIFSNDACYVITFNVFLVNENHFKRLISSIEQIMQLAFQVGLSLNRDL